MKRFRLCMSIIVILDLFFLPCSHADIDITGPHGKFTNQKGICSICHIPHYSKGSKIWARNLSGEYAGIKSLCYSCHDGTMCEECTSLGEESAFSPDYETHVMHGAADIYSNVVSNYDSSVFPLDPNDEDSVLGHPDEWDKCRSDPECNGFYCGSCHNPHKQPESDPNGSYLRSKKESEVGMKGNRTPFCQQCHEKNLKTHFDGDNCQACHHPHKGVIVAKADMSYEEQERKYNNAARLIFLEDVFEASQFKAEPNVSKINDREEPFDPAASITENMEFLDSSYFCYGCHQPRHKIGSGDRYNVWRKAGAAPIYGDIITDIFNDNSLKSDPNALEHHPMGVDAQNNGSHYKRYAGISDRFNNSGELTCISCHVNHITEDVDSYSNLDKKNNFLRFGEYTEGFSDDNAGFCLLCHLDKGMSTNYSNIEKEASHNTLDIDNIEYDKKHFRTDISSITSSKIKRKVFSTQSPYYKEVPSLQCMFCHFIHDGTNRGDEQDEGRADLDALMRVPPRILDTGERIRTEPVYYEDLCYGCHGDEEIVGPQGKGGAFLNISPLDPHNNDYFFSHRFASKPDSENPPYKTMSDQNTQFPLADSEYGTELGQIYCGTCHDVHAQYDPESPYLNSGESPYKVDGFCEACHNKDGKFVSESHPIGVGPNPDPAQGAPTPAEFVDTYNGGGALFSEGGSGRPGGITSPYDPAIGKSGKSTMGGKGKVICLTCHNVHAAETSYSGETKGDDREIHGKLLVKDNFIKDDPKSPGSELCKACHPFLPDNNENTQYAFPSGKHNAEFSKSNKGVCNICHTPHNKKGNFKKGPKLWNLDGYYDGPFEGYRQLCLTCHNDRGGYCNGEIITEPSTKGKHTVFKSLTLGDTITDLSIKEDHVMWKWAKIGLDYKIDNFPLDKSEEDDIHLASDCIPEYQETDGFYCGSCHDVHIWRGFQYLRGELRSQGDFAPFCRECHPEVHEETTDKCQKCHKVHEGAVNLCKDSLEGRWVLKAPVERRAFSATPNVQGLEDNFFVKDNTKYDAPFCYGCHGTHAYEEWVSAGLKPIFGDDPNDADLSREHHPMGKEATESSPRLDIQSGKNIYFTDRDRQITCRSCHRGIHGGTKENYFLEWDPDWQNDKISFCLTCHNDKNTLLIEGTEKSGHLVKANDPVVEEVDPNNNSFGCMFCHFVHNGGDEGIEIMRADVDALMRVKPNNLVTWGDRTRQGGTIYYEDMCFGCHFDSSIVKEGCQNGSLLRHDDNFPYTHRFAVIPNSQNPPSTIITPGKYFPKSDGAAECKDDGCANNNGGCTNNDYGAPNGTIFCGTCHRVHDNTVSPYLNYPCNPYDKRYRMDYGDFGFCEYCHNVGEGLGHSHPTGDSLDDFIDNIPEEYFSDGTGCNGINIKSNDGTMICLSCHNVHAAATNWEGSVPSDSDNKIHGKLLFMDNKSTDEGSDMCRICHQSL